VAGRRIGTATTVSVPTSHRHGRNSESQRADQRVLRADGGLHCRRSAALQPLRRLGLSSRLLLLLRHSVHYRVRRLRAGYQPGCLRVAGEDGSLRAISRVRTGAVGNVL